VASQEVIKEPGTNGGGFFNVNSAMPFENPNGITNAFKLLLMPSSRPDSPRRSGGWWAAADRAGRSTPRCSCCSWSASASCTPPRRTARRRSTRRASRAATSSAPRARIPADAVQTSASGVDPQISLANARLQAVRVAARTGLPKARVLALVKADTDDRSLGFFGEPGVNVLELNLAIQEAARR
jgi:K+-transporting ATPase, c chain/Potassium-transporting ATPase A subunit